MLDKCCHATVYGSRATVSGNNQKLYIYELYEKISVLPGAGQGTQFQV